MVGSFLRYFPDEERGGIQKNGMGLDGNYLLGFVEGIALFVREIENSERDDGRWKHQDQDSGIYRVDRAGPGGGGVLVAHGAALRAEGHGNRHEPDCR
jgi:hypothetical protein